MHPGAPIPESAQFDDPIWKSRFLDLANGMVLMGAKPVLIHRYTGLSPKVIAELYKRLTGQEAPSGRLQQALPKHYAIPHNRGGLEWILQTAAYASTFLKFEKALDIVPNRGWLLLHSYQAYMHLTDPLQQEIPRLSRVTLNNAYDMMIHLGVGPTRKGARLALRDCDECGGSHLVVTDQELDHQTCPMCAIQKRFMRLVENSQKISADRQMQKLVISA